MSESIIDKKLRILGDALEDSPAVLRAVQSREWTARDASAYRAATGGVKRSSFKDRVAGIVKK